MTKSNSVELLSSDLETLVGFGPRARGDITAIRQTVEFIQDSLAGMGYEPLVDRFDTGIDDCNILAERSGSWADGPLLEIGAHWDTVPGSPGADDNGSGVVALLDIARHFAALETQRAVRFCFFGREESGLKGSLAHQNRLDGESRPFAGAVIFEMIGYRRTDPGSQRTPIRLPLIIWPPRVGDFITLVGNFRSLSLAARFESAASKHAPQLEVYPVKRLGGFLTDAARSDHASYWRSGRRAIMLTDTANFRNPNYHLPSDTIETIDFEFLANIATATRDMAAAWAASPPG